MHRTMIALCSAAIATQPASADTLPPVWVAEGTNDAGLSECNLDYSVATATAQSTLRYNRVALAQKEDYFADRAIEIVIDLTAFEIKRVDGQPTGTCAIGMSFFLGTYTKPFDPVHKNIKWATVHYCDEGTLFTLDKISAQGSVDQRITQYTDECLALYEKLKAG